MALGCGCGKAADGSGAEAEGDWNACQGLVEELSNALYELAVTGNHRIGRMCVSPSGLACWALELLEEQACQVSNSQDGDNMASNKSKRDALTMVRLQVQVQ